MAVLNKIVIKKRSQRVTRRRHSAVPNSTAATQKQGEP
jgi:hypothetical protein